MRKLVFISFVAWSAMFGEVWSMPPNPFENLDTSSSVPVTHAEIDEMRRGDQRIRDDLRNQQEMNNNYIHDLIAQISRLTTSVQSLENKVSDLTNQNNDLQAQNNSLNRRLADVLNSIDQKKLDAMNAANALKEKELIQKKAEADAVAKREKERISRNNQRNEQLKKLEHERDRWSRYVDGREKYPVRPGSMMGSFEEAKIARYRANKKIAPQKIQEIDRQIANVRASFE